MIEINFQLVIVYLRLGVVSSLISYVFLKNLINEEQLLRSNYADKKIACIGGLVPLTALFIAQAVDSLFSETQSRTDFAQTALVVTLGYAFIGLLDDLAGSKSSQGFKGHIKSLLKGQLTTGALKLFGGPIIAFFAFSGGIESRGFLPVIIDSLTVAIIANTFNLLDLAPGRSSKYMLIFAVSTFFLNVNRDFLIVIIGVLIVTMLLDLREKFMLGDVGANLFGALLGFYLVSEISDETTLIVFFVFVALNLVSEFISFSKIINSIWPLRFFDEIGQLQARRDFNWEKRQKS